MSQIFQTPLYRKWNTCLVGDQGWGRSSLIALTSKSLFFLLLWAQYCLGIHPLLTGQCFLFGFGLGFSFVEIGAP
jgi:hypothetical protein